MRVFRRFSARGFSFCFVLVAGGGASWRAFPLLLQLYGLWALQRQKARAPAKLAASGFRAEIAGAGKTKAKLNRRGKIVVWNDSSQQSRENVCVFFALTFAVFLGRAFPSRWKVMFFAGAFSRACSGLMPMLWTKKKSRLWGRFTTWKVESDEAFCWQMLQH